MLVVPSLQGLPKVSDIITPIECPDIFFKSSLIRVADLSGSGGNGLTTSSPGRFDASTPELAQINP
jgi:hypothetical protein